MGATEPVARWVFSTPDEVGQAVDRWGAALPILVPKSSVSGLFGTIWPSSSRSGEKSARIAVDSTDFVASALRRQFRIAEGGISLVEPRLAIPES